MSVSVIGFGRSGASREGCPSCLWDSIEGDLRDLARGAKETEIVNPPVRKSALSGGRLSHL